MGDLYSLENVIQYAGNIKSHKGKYMKLQPREISPDRGKTRPDDGEIRRLLQELLKIDELREEHHRETLRLWGEGLSYGVFTNPR